MLKLICSLLAVLPLSLLLCQILSTSVSKIPGITKEMGNSSKDLFEHAPSTPNNIFDVNNFNKHSKGGNYRMLH